jgi:glycosyltransferase involved in cell wall biosynthesis
MVHDLMNDGNAKRVSYILATKNRSALLERSIQNVRQFITDRDELVIVDGGSTDDTAKVIERNRDIIGIFLSESDYGEAHAINKGILAARGEYLKFLSDDDFIFGPCMAGVIRAMENNPRIDALLCGGEHCRLETDGTTKLDFFFRLTGDRAAEVGRPAAETSDTAGPGLGLIIRRRVISLVGLFDTSFLCVDTEFLARLKRPQVVLRYYDGKLYRHVDYPHSGVSSRDRANVDAVRTYVRARAWSAIRHYGAATVARALGLDHLPGGELCARIVLGTESLRPFWLGRLVLRGNAALLGLITVLTRGLSRLRRLSRAKAGSQDVSGWPETEPEWLNDVI